MRTTIERVRAAMVVGAALVALTVAGFLAVAHYRAHRSLQDLPARLGLDIQKETNGYTVSQSVKGHTVFTLHAAKATQHKDGITALQDVGVVLYGQTGGRADRIYGKQFDYDQKNGVVRAMGEVQLDLQAPAPVTASARAEYARGGKGETKAGTGDADAQPIHVVTSGLVYVQSLGVASTDQPIRFAYQGMTGQARGASYNSDTGVTTLESEVRVSAVRDGRPTVLTAAHAEMDRANHRMTLRAARYVALSKVESERSAGETMTAGLMVVHLGQDGGGIESAEGSNGVEVASGESRMQAPQGVVHMTAEGRAEMAQMTGGVRFASEQASGAGAGNTLEGQAASGTAHFNGRGEMEMVRLTGGVSAQSQTVSAEETREMVGGEMELRLAGYAGGSRRWVQEATMRGAARVTSVLPAVQGHTAGTEEMRGDVLVGEWRQERGAAALREVTGEGHTEIRRVRDGVDEVSRGDRLRAEFGAVARTGPAGRSGIVTATQQGGVALERIATTKRASAGEAKTSPVEATTETTRGRAERADYEAATGQVNLMGGAEISDGASTVRAERVAMTEGTGDAEAQGAVQVTYRQVAAAGATPGGEVRAVTETGGETKVGTAAETKLPIHAVAERAVMRKATGVTTFFGGSSPRRGGTPAPRARLWQGPSQVEAPVLVFGRKDSTLDAYGEDAGEAMPVRTVLASAPHAAAAEDDTAKKRVPAVVRVQSGRLHYAEGLRRAEFSRGVVLEDADGTMTSREAVALLLPSAPKDGVPASGKGVGAAGLAGAAGDGVAGGGGRGGGGGVGGGGGGRPGGGLDRVTAVGDVVIRQTGRVATGQQAVYTATDGMFVLTGGGGVPPKVVDEANGTISGAALRFRSGDNSVTVDGRAKDGASATGDGRVHTRTKVKQKG